LARAVPSGEAKPLLPEPPLLPTPLVGVVLKHALHRLAPLLPRLSRLALPLDRRLLVVSASLHFLKEAVLQHLLLELLEGSLDLVVEDLDLHYRALRCRVE